MPSEQHTKEFKSRLAAVLDDLNTTGKEDPEVLWLIGSLAGRIVESGGKGTWPATKAALTQQSYDNLLKSFEDQGNALFQKGNEKAAYAVQAVAVSVVASKMSDPDISRGDQLLDQFINRTIKMFRQANAAESAKPS